MNINTAIDQLVAFAEDYLMLDQQDTIYARNRILSIINLQEYRASKEELQDITSADKTLAALIDACYIGKMIDDKEKTAQRIMRALSLSPSEITDIYADTASQNKEKADKWLDEYLTLSKLDTKLEGDAFGLERTADGVCFSALEVRAEEELAGVYDAIDDVVEYAVNNLLLDILDKEYAIQDILDIIGLKSYEGAEEAGEVTEYDRPDAVLEVLGAALLNAKLVSEDELEGMLDMIMGALSLRPSQVSNLFGELCETNSKKATEWLYDYGIKNNYIKRTLLDSNIRFKAPYTKRGIEITINKAKPEFADAKKAASGNAIKSGYPKCTICAENEGCSFRQRCTLRTAELQIGGKEWFWQYSPYGYFYKHGIAVNKEHVPMVVNAGAVGNLMDFAKQIPNFFIGCNAAMTGVGGSVLAHDHYQGGEEVLPMHKAKVYKNLAYPKYPLAEIGVLDWYNSVIRITSQSRQVVTEICEDIISGWEKYDDKSKDIVSKDADGQHNGVSPTVRRIDNGRYCVDITLRNNRTTTKYPAGIFHAHPEFHAIKKESIGLIESQGLFILPGRLEKQIEVLRDCLVEKQPLPADMADFQFIYDEIIAENGRDYTKVEAMIAIKAELGSVCERILENTAVFKTMDETVDFLLSLGTFQVK